VLKKSAAVNYSKSPEMDDIGTQTNERCRKVFLDYATTVHTGEDIMSFTVNLKIDFNWLQQSTTNYRTEDSVTI